jgi:twitching motility protein PilT
MKERIAVNTYRLRKLAMGMKVFTINDLATASGVSKQTVYDFVRDVREKDTGFLKEEVLAPLKRRPGRGVHRYTVTPEGLEYLIAEHAPFVQDLNDAAAERGAVLRPLRQETKPSLVKWKERVDSWLGTILPDFEQAVGQGASALLIKSEEMTAVRMGGAVCSFAKARKWTTDEVSEAVQNILTPLQMERLEKQGWTACSYRSELHRPLDVCVRLAEGKPMIELRYLPEHVPSLKDLHLSHLVEELCSLKSGLILVTGLAGSGRSATVAAMVGSINSREHGYITTIEEPIHYFHDRQKSFIEQKQIAVDTPDFSHALELALANRSSVVALSDITDQNSFSTAMAAAERTLMICRFTAPGPGEAIRKLVSLVPAAEQAAARSRLAANLSGIICVVGLAGSKSGMVSATEVMRWRPEAKEAIVDPDKTGFIVEELAQREGSVERMGESVHRLYREKLISEETAGRYVADLDQFATHS